MKQKVESSVEKNVLDVMRQIVLNVIDQTTEQHDVIDVIDQTTEQHNVLNVIDQTTEQQSMINVIDVIDKTHKQQDVKIVIDKTTEQQNTSLDVINVIEQTTEQQDVNVINVIDKIQEPQDVRNVIDRTTEQQKLNLNLLSSINDDIDVIEQTTQGRTTAIYIINHNKDAKTSTSISTHNVKVSQVPEQNLGHGLCPQPSDPSMNFREGFRTTENNSRAIPKQQLHCHIPNPKQKHNSGVT